MCKGISRLKCFGLDDNAICRLTVWLNYTGILFMAQDSWTPLQMQKSEDVVFDTFISLVVENLHY